MPTEQPNSSSNWSRYSSYSSSDSIYPVISTSPFAPDSVSVVGSIIIDTVGMGLSVAALALLPFDAAKSVVCPPGNRPTPFCPAAAALIPCSPFSISGTSCATSRARFSLNWRYVVVLGITSARNSRLSIRETAVAIAQLVSKWRNFYRWEQQVCVPRSLYCMVFRGLRSDLRTLYPCSARYWMNSSWED